jgi:hypothetical protein
MKRIWFVCVSSPARILMDAQMRPKYIFSIPIVASFLLFAPLCPVAGQQTLPNSEPCVKLMDRKVNSATNTKVTITNICDKPIAIQYMNSRNQREIQKQLNPGETFVGEWPNPGWYMGAICKIGYISTVVFVASSQDTIEKGNYRCTKH